MKFHHHLVTAVVQSLLRIFEEGIYADKVIEKTLKQNPKWGSRDRAFIAETTYDVVRNWRFLYEINGAIAKTPAEMWEIVAIYFSILKENELPLWAEFESVIARKEELIQNFKEKAKNIACRYSIPDWIQEKGAEIYGKNWPSLLEALNMPAAVILRVNSFKTNTKTLQSSLEKENVSTEKIGDFALKVTKRQNLFATTAFQNGWFEVQDWGSQQIAPYLEVQAGMRVVDACAGAGGKALHLSNLMQNKGKIIALDVEERKLTELQKRYSRSGADNIETRLINSTKVIKRLYGSADRLLLDVPCSGMGVLRRNPDAKWKIQPTFIDEIKTIQADILEKYAPICKVGGKIVYATCSILPEENEWQVKQFIDKSEGNYELIRQQTLLPNDFGYDGFYMALIQRKG